MAQPPLSFATLTVNTMEDDDGMAQDDGPLGCNLKMHRHCQIERVRESESELETKQKGKREVRRDAGRYGWMDEWREG